MIRLLELFGLQQETRSITKREEKIELRQILTGNNEQ